MDPTPLPPTATQPRPSWWSRNWKWFLPVGGCGGCLFLIGLGLIFFSSIFVAVFGAMKSTDVYKTALSRAKESPEVVAALGTPIKEGFFVSGNTKADGPSGEANLSIPISGPKGSGTIYVAAEKKAGRWTYSTLEVEIDATKERINLNDD
ncbi:MAG: cytochrome c oxidase assembly factor Coa1 family protein [Chthoniobacterales bacterium]